MKRVLIAIFVISLAIAGVLYALGIGAPQSAPQDQSQVPPVQTVSVVTIRNQRIDLTDELPGRITSFRQSQVRPQVDGIVMERLFKEGGRVEKGDQLYHIDDARYKAALNSAIADLKSVEANIKSVEARTNRYKKLVKINAISQQEYDDVIAEYDQAKAAIGVAQAAVDMAQVNLDYTKVYAPISGRISRSFVTEGALVTANQAQPLATITQLDPIYVDMQQSGEKALQLRSQMSGNDSVAVDIMMGEGDGHIYPHQGTLQFSEVTIDETTGSIALRAQVPNPDNVLLPGLFVRAKLHVGTMDALLVPQRATMRSPDGTLKIWTVDANNAVHQKTITAHDAYRDSWIITDGVQTGDVVIVEGYQKVGEGVTVNPTLWEQDKNTQTPTVNVKE